MMQTNNLMLEGASRGVATVLYLPCISSVQAFTTTSLTSAPSALTPLLHFAFQLLFIRPKRLLITLADFLGFPD